MERTVMMQLKNWKNSQFRKPLILTGARQVGKTYVLKEFGKKEFKNVAYVNCDNNPDVRSLFDEDYDMKKVLMIIGAITKQPIVPGETLIILDEIQELPRGLSSLKYFCEKKALYKSSSSSSSMPSKSPKSLSADTLPPKWSSSLNFIMLLRPHATPLLPLTS